MITFVKGIIIVRVHLADFFFFIIIKLKTSRMKKELKTTFSGLRGITNIFSKIVKSQR